MADSATKTLSLASWQKNDSWVTVFIGGVRLGPPSIICKVSKIGQSLLVQHKKGSGMDGGNVTLRGLEIPKFTILCKVYDGDGEAAWNDVVKRIFPVKDPKQRNAVSFQHPSAATLRIGQVIVQGIEQELSDDGVLHGTIHIWGAVARQGGSKTAKPTVDPLTIALPTNVPQYRDIRDLTAHPSANPPVQ